MGYRDEEGNWIEEFRSQAYPTETEALNKINAVIDFHIYESGWELNGTPRVEKDENGYVAVIPIMKPAELKNPMRR